MPMLTMTILIPFGCVIGPLCHLHSPYCPTCRTILQPSYLAHTRPASWLLGTVYGVFYVPVSRINPHMAMTITMQIAARKRENRRQGTTRAIVKCPLCAYKTPTKIARCFAWKLRNVHKMRQRPHSRATCHADLAAGLVCVCVCVNVRVFGFVCVVCMGM